MRKLTKNGKIVVAILLTCLLTGALVGGAMYYDYWQANRQSTIITAHAEENAEETTDDIDKAEEVSEEEETVELLSTNELENQEDALWSIDDWVDKKFADVSHELGLSTLSVNPYTGADIALTRGQAAGFENALGFPMDFFKKHHADYGYDTADIKCVKQEIKASLKAAGVKVDKEDLEKMAIYTAVILKEPVYGEVWANFLKEKAQLRSGRMLADVVQSGGVYFVNEFLERCATARGFDNLDDYLRAVNNEDVEPTGTSSCFSDYWTTYNADAKRAFVTDAVAVSSGEEQGYWYYAQGLALVALRWSSLGVVEDTATVHYVNNLSPFNNGVMGILATCEDPRESLLLRVTDKDGEVNTNIGVNLYDMSPVWYPRTKDIPVPTTTVQQNTKPQPKTEIKKVTRPQPNADPKTSKTPKSKVKEQPKKDPTISQTPTKEKKDGEGYKDPKADPVNQGNAPVGGGDNPVIPGEESSGPLEGDPAEDHTGSNADPKDVVPQTPAPGETDESRKDEVVDHTDENKMTYEPDNTKQSTTWTDNVTGASETYDGSKPDNNPGNTGSSNTDKSKNPVNEEPAAGEFSEPL